MVGLTPDRLDRVFNELAARLAPESKRPAGERPPVVVRRIGLVTAITGSTLTVSLNGVPIAAVPRLAAYSPTVGDTVRIDIVGTDLVVVGKLA